MRTTALSSIPFLLLLFIGGAVVGANNDAFQLPSKSSLIVQENLHNLKKTQHWRRKTCLQPNYLESFQKQQATLAKSYNSDGSIDKLLILRGGETTIPPPPPKKELITFTQHLAGSTFYFFSILYGVACALSPLKTARFFYGYNEDSMEQKNNAKSGTFLMRMIGAVTVGIGLTAAFAVGFELREGATGSMPSSSSFDFAMGIGLIPRFVFLCYALFVSDIPSSLRITKNDARVLLLETLYFIYTTFCGKKGGSEIAVMIEVAFSLLLGPLFFFKPSVIYDEDIIPSRHEKLVIRLLASYAIMRGILSAGLAHPTTNALPAVGFTALAWVATLFHLTFVRKDVGECECSVPTHIAMMVCGVAVAVGGLHHYFTV